MTVLPRLAQQSLLIEVSLAPKPGLVDPFSVGAHVDMDYDLFITSIQAWSPYLKQYLMIGATSSKLTTLFATLRQVGAQGEAAMLTATHQVNTHKGANFSYAILLGALGWCLKTQTLKQICAQRFTTVFQTVKMMTAGITTADFAHVLAKSHWSYGEALYVKQGVTGIRGEAEAGYPMLQNVALPFLAQHADLPAALRYLQLMVYLMAKLEDVNLLHRGGRSGLIRVQQAAQAILDQGLTTAPSWAKALNSLDQQLIDWHLSPGGTADLLALSIFFDQVVVSPVSWDVIAKGSKHEV
ncbi:triphosphoribosyl-dephospho-CoA synthase CitG [Lactobacillus sp. CBA3606]|uniref:triphosphoribosyl-dephospho-CoA synthase CitG n=1 Tax=Lactobacillus sp. CBA3606 TaxID=2099789 RepID=UPI000CFC7123|nr:triphosphoribosyl-dephospho-CoA synthase CitG [Lactobacillus sp. CBA3606]